jgi:hypothetical protein
MQPRSQRKTHSGSLVVLEFESKAANPAPFEGGSASVGTEFGQGGLEE